MRRYLRKSVWLGPRHHSVFPECGDRPDKKLHGHDETHGLLPWLHRLLLLIQVPHDHHPDCLLLLLRISQCHGEIRCPGKHLEPDCVWDVARWLVRLHNVVVHIRADEKAYQGVKQERLVEEFVVLLRSGHRLSLPCHRYPTDNLLGVVTHRVRRGKQGYVELEHQKLLPRL